MVLFVLFESPSGFALFERTEVDDSEKQESAIVQSLMDFTWFGKLFKLKAFVPYLSAADALEMSDCVSEGQVPETLKNFLEMNLPKKMADSELGVGDEELGSAINVALSIRCVTNESILEILRAIRLHFHKIVGSKNESDRVKDHLGLAHITPSPSPLYCLREPSASPSPLPPPPLLSHSDSSPSSSHSLPFSTSPLLSRSDSSPPLACSPSRIPLSLSHSPPSLSPPSSPLSSYREGNEGKSEEREGEEERGEKVEGGREEEEERRREENVSFLSSSFWRLRNAGAQKPSSGTIALSRFNSTLNVSESAILLELQRHRKEIDDLKRQMRRHEMLQDQWSLRYAKRVAILSNLLLGLWIFWMRLQEFVQGSKGKVLHLLFPSLTPSLFSQMRLSKQKAHPSVNHLLRESLFYSVHHSWIFFFCAFLLSRPMLWKRLGAVGLSSVWSLYLVHTHHLWPWTNYFNIMSNLIYLTAYQKDINQYIRSIKRRILGFASEAKDPFLSEQSLLSSAPPFSSSAPSSQPPLFLPSSSSSTLSSSSFSSSSSQPSLSLAASHSPLSRRRGD